MEKIEFEKMCEKAGIKKEALCDTVFTRQFKGVDKVEKIDRKGILERLSSKLICPERLRYNKKERTYIVTWLKSSHDQADVSDYAFTIERVIPGAEVLLIKQINRKDFYLNREIIIKFKI